jgi:pilus assembly protein CpaC
MALVLALAAGQLGSTAARAQRGPASAVRVDRTEVLDLAVGENKTIPATNVANFSEGAPGVADVKLTTDGSQFVVVGLKAGTTTLLLIYRDGSQRSWTISVFARSPNDVEQELKQLLQGCIGVHLRRVGSRFFIEGGVSSEADQKRIQHIASLYPGQVESLVQIGSVAQDRQLNVRIDFFFVQFDRDYGHNFGLSWPAVVGGTDVGGNLVLQNQVTYDFIAHAVTTATASIVNQPLPSLDVAAHRGWAKVLRQATIVTGNGNEAKFSSGGEQNFAITNNLTANIRPIEFGLNLSLLPRFDATSRDMEVKVSADIGDLTPPASGTTLPGRNTSKLETIVHLKLGQSIVLSGISTRSQRHNVQGLPLLSDIPVLGVLFGSLQHEESDTEGAIFIVPSVIDSLPAASASLIEHALREYEHYAGGIGRVAPYSRTPPVLDPPGVAR